MLEETGRKENPPTLLMRIEFSKIIMENSMEVLKKNRNRITIRSSNPTPMHTSVENPNSKDTRQTSLGVQWLRIHLAMQGMSI